MALEELYRYYEANQQMIANVLRDSAIMPVGAGFRALQAAAAGALLAGHPTGREAPGYADAVRLATDFRAWQAMASPSALSPGEAADLMGRMLTCL